MLTLLGGKKGAQFCDGHSRRSFLKIGGLAMGGLSMPDLLRAAASADSPRKSGGLGHKAVIMVYLPGGPPHQDMFDLKVDAPVEIRGEFNPIKTNVTGIEICELLPRMAKMMDKLTAIRTIVGAKDRHESFQCLTGRLNERQPPGGWPEMGAVISKLQGYTKPGITPFMGLSPRMKHTPYNNGNPGFLGAAHAPFMPMAEGKSDLTLNGITLERLHDRQALLKSFDSFRRDVDNSRMMESMDAFADQAFGVLTSSKLADALDISQEDPRTIARYGKGTTQVQGDAAPRINSQFLLARRLVEAGVRCVTLSYSFWDWHGHNAKRAKENLPDLDQAVTALVQDLHDRGLDKDVTVLVWGEFGRTPKINKDGGRDHWPKVSCALMACGGMKHGQYIGETTKDAGEPKERPVHFQEVFATVYKSIGIDPHTSMVEDLTGRPTHIVDAGYNPMPELI